jgi:hypothetical protein
VALPLLEQPPTAKPAMTIKMTLATACRWMEYLI